MTTAPTVTADYAAPTTRGPSRPLHRMPLVWAAVGIPAAFVLFLTFLTPSL
jgi:hypothetical protein